MIKELNAVEAGDYAYSLIKDGFDLDTSKYSDLELSNLTSLLHAVRRARIVEKYGIKGK